ncbi:non-homologous end joining protein Ku [Hufsiella ginkgonis]|uniref:Non-homologous end joining protein Ku n=1 Tax=Hufsiella ginkgonis TaxID=2695274 RepID=A0A7K1XWH0_9SPHI|nr:Ku protein [Hufsiella ginkgonis]MXV15325.1 Ku protein [Hufsiella ginkgonis]
MRAIWKGSIGFGLVNIPIKLYSAVQESSLGLDMLDSRDHERIRYQRINEKTRKEVPYEKIVKGYAVGEAYVILEEQDFEDASPEKTKIIELENFVELDEVNPIYYETSYYSEPETQGRKAYALLLKALQKSKKAGLARFVLRSTENLCIIHPVENVIVVTKIRFAEEIRPVEEISTPDLTTIGKKELDMGLALINQYSSRFDINKFKDTYHAELLKIIKAKAKGKRPTIKKLKPKKDVGDDLYEQLMQSLGKGA